MSSMVTFFFSARLSSSPVNARPRHNTASEHFGRGGCQCAALTKPPSTHYQCGHTVIFGVAEKQEGETPRVARLIRESLITSPFISKENQDELWGWQLNRRCSRQFHSAEETSVTQTCSGRLTAGGCCAEQRVCRLLEKEDSRDLLHSLSKGLFSLCFLTYQWRKHLFFKSLLASDGIWRGSCWVSGWETHCPHKANAISDAVPIWQMDPVITA